MPLQKQPKQENMKRRIFIKKTAISAVAVSAFGFISFDGEKYVGDCATTSDILGPFYRPGSPLRSNFYRQGDSGKKITLRGKILHKDCATPYQNAKVELWHCDALGVYDNSSEEFRYRGTVMTDTEGHYAFQTVLPVPYDAGGGLIRPAHFHMMVTAEGYQPLVTQLYFTGDANIEEDPWASNSLDRVLPVQEEKDGSSLVFYTVGMAPVLSVEPASLIKLTGMYASEENPEKEMELLEYKNELWVKNEVFGSRFVYTGNNVFESPNYPEGYKMHIAFEILAAEKVIATINRQSPNGQWVTSTYHKKK